MPETCICGAEGPPFHHRENCTELWKKKKEQRPFYVTTFCNFAHYLDTGRPIGHECYVLQPKDLKREMEAEDGDDLSDIYQKKGPIVIGRDLPDDP